MALPTPPPALKLKKVIDSKPDEQRQPVKLILLGDSAVGKTKLVERFLMQRYVPIQMSTYALTLFHYDFIAEEANGSGGGAAGDREIDVDIWDTAGQERFASVHSAYYHNAYACILVFDATRKQTYKNMEKWLKELRNIREHIPCIVACNKIDTDPDVVNKSFAFADKHQFPLFYVSAADGTNVVQLFEAAINYAVAYKDNPEKDYEALIMEVLREKPTGAVGAPAAAPPGNNK